MAQSWPVEQLYFLTWPASFMFPFSSFSFLSFFNSDLSHTHTLVFQVARSFFYGIRKENKAAIILLKCWNGPLARLIGAYNGANQYVFSVHSPLDKTTHFHPHINDAICLLFSSPQSTIQTTVCPAGKEIGTGRASNHLKMVRDD